ncbi:MAG TPA: CpaD family pilus assembly protein [Vicinamibacterales bacterium]
MTMPVPNLTRNLRIAVALLGASAALGACTHTDQETVTSSVPRDYRQRHPIVIQEANRATEVFVGTGRGGLTTAQRSDIAGLAEAWLREGTGGIVIDMPANTPNARVATDSLREIQAILAAAGVPPRGITIRNYRPTDPRLFATIRVNYPRITADAGPCGLWPDDLGPSIKNKGYLENQPYYNLGCATQRNLAAMVDNPSDLVQPRAETPAYTPRRNIAFDKYRKGTTTTTVYPEADKAKLSEVGK